MPAEDNVEHGDEAYNVEHGDEADEADTKNPILEVEMATRSRQGQEEEEEFPTFPTDDEVADRKGGTTRRIENVNELALGMYAGATGSGFARQLSNTVVPILGVKLGLSHRAIGLASSCVGAGRLAGNAPTAALGRSLGDEWMIVLGHGVLVAAGVLLGLARNLGVLCGGMLLLGVHLNTLQISHQSWLRLAVSDDLRGRALSLLGGIQRVAAILGPLVGGLVSHARSPSLALVAFVPACGAIAVVFTAAFLPAVRDDGDGAPPTSLSLMTRSNSSGQQTSSSTSSSSSTTGSLVTTYRYVLRRHWRSLLWSSAIGFFFMWLRTARELLLPLHGLQRGLNDAKVGTVVSIGYIVDAACGVFVSGTIMDTRGRKVSAVLSAFVMAGGFGCLAVAKRPFGEMVLASTVLGAGNGLSSGLVMTITTDLAPLRHRAVFISLFRFASDLGVLVGAFFAGLISHATATKPAAAWHAWLAGAFCVVIALFVPETLRKRRPQRTRDPQPSGDKPASLLDSARAAVANAPKRFRKLPLAPTYSIVDTDDDDLARDDPPKSTNGIVDLKEEEDVDNDDLQVEDEVTV